ncbi:hypothetical protein D9615_003352 [Tricholomella constricta]|uniref:Origin recognition complex subunit 3 n=1 Tax=Tricholomella constricta TaxID=117010 RepID=A0A8H5M811_9AGAR|nr:hypothetical protein D9615_003352 [Tricholomella constricta]
MPTSIPPPKPAPAKPKKDRKDKDKDKPPLGTERLKTVVRRLPPNLPEEIFWGSVDTWVSEDSVSWKTFYPGKLRKRLNKENVPSRAYIAFRNEEQLALFSREYDGHLFRDKAGNEYQAVVEFAPYPKIPSEKKKVDARNNTIEKDEDYISFVESLKASANPEPVSIESLIAASQPPPPPKTTPLLEALKAEKTAHKDKEAILRNHAHYKDPSVLATPRKEGGGGVDTKKKGAPVATQKPADAHLPGASKKAPGKKQVPGPGPPVPPPMPQKQPTAMAKNPVPAPGPSSAPKAPKPPRAPKVTQQAAPKQLQKLPLAPAVASGSGSAANIPVPTPAPARRTRPVIGLASRHFEAALSGAGVSAGAGAGGRSRREREREKEGEAGAAGVKPAPPPPPSPRRARNHKEPPSSGNAPGKVPGILQAPLSPPTIPAVVAEEGGPPSQGGGGGRGGRRSRGRGRGGGVVDRGQSAPLDTTSMSSFWRTHVYAPLPTNHTRRRSSRWLPVALAALAACLVVVGGVRLIFFRPPRYSPLTHYQNLNAPPLVSGRLPAASSKRAIVSTLYSDSYAIAVAVLGHSARAANVTGRLLLPYLDGRISESALCVARTVGWEPVAVPFIPPPHHGKGIYHRFFDQYTKLNIWGLPDVDTAVYLDADTLVLHNFGELFDLPFAFAAVPDVYDDSRRGFTVDFNAGVMVFRPDPAVLETMKAKLEVAVYPLKQAEQSFLNLFFGPTTLRLPYAYNANLAIKKRSPKMWQGMREREEIRIVHYTLTKPFVNERAAGHSARMLDEEQQRLVLDQAAEVEGGLFREEVGWWRDAYDRMMDECAPGAPHNPHAILAMAITKIPFIIATLTGTQIAYTSPAPPIREGERIDEIKSAIKASRFVPLGKAIFWTFALPEIAAILASMAPSFPASQFILSVLLIDKENAMNIQITVISVFGACLSAFGGAGGPILDGLSIISGNWPVDMNAVLNLNDPNQTAFYIPFAGNDDGDEEVFNTPLPRSIYHERDLPDGEEVRFDAYTEAWRKCLDRIKSIIQALHAPVAADVVQQVYASYDNVLPGLPYPELPVVTVTNPTSGSTFLNQITAHIDSFDLDNCDLFDATALTVHLYPSDCVNLTSTMKNIISGFVDRSHILEKVKGRPATSLANYDMETLLAWYTALRDTYNLQEEGQPKLVVLFHDFEQLDPTVMQDVFNISSLYIPRLPLIFIIALSSPASPSYLYTTYPRSTLALLCVRNYTVPYGTQVLEEVLTKVTSSVSRADHTLIAFQTFFDVEFEPDIMIGSSVLTVLADYYGRQNSSLDATLSILHLAHLKHFSTEPLTLLTKSTPSFDTLAQHSSYAFTDALLTRLQPSAETAAATIASDWSKQTLSSLITSIDNARTSFYSRVRRLRIGFGIVKLVQDFMTKQGYKGLDWGLHPGGVSILDVMNDVLRGKSGSDVKFLGTMVRKLRVTQLGALLELLHTYFNSMPSMVRSGEEEARTKLVFSINALPSQTADEDVSGIGSQVAASFGEWLVDYVNDLLTPLEDATLWDIWYTGQSPFPTDLINPSLRASMVASLLHPHDFAEQSDKEDEERSSFPLWELPDTSILFRRYLDSGRMINLYDWFESFQLELENQRQNLRKREAEKAKPKPRSPTKRARKAKAKAVEEEEPEEEEDLERWKLEVQARFMRALQELDYLGLIKHTGRKADHVQRVLFDMHD